jgi:hypothetical protein
MVERMSDAMTNLQVLGTHHNAALYLFRQVWPTLGDTVASMRVSNAKEHKKRHHGHVQAVHLNIIAFDNLRGVSLTGCNDWKSLRLISWEGLDP